MSAGLAPPTVAFDRADPDAIRLRSHEFVADARSVGDWLLVVPNEHGLRMLRRHGKPGLVAHWQRWLTCVAGGSRVRWRLVEALPPADSVAELHCLQPVHAPIVGTAEPAGQGSLRCTVRVPYDLAVFEGHFPAIPVVPAVVQIGWAIDLFRAHLRPGARFRGIATAKFRCLMQPGMNLQLALDTESGGDRVRFEYSAAGSSVSSGRMSFEPSRG